LFGKAGLQEFSEDMIRNEKVLNVTKKVRVSADNALSEIFPSIQAAIVTIRTTDNEFTKRVDYPKGEPENSLTDQEFRARYDELMEYARITADIRADVFEKVYKEDTTVSEAIEKL
jgi:2-methylcitrate dehydratase PrpD